MTKTTKLAAIAAIATALSLPAFAEEKTQSVKTNDPFVSTQGSALVLGPVGVTTAVAVVVATVVAVADSSTSTTTTN